jgi:hypothetical protein
LNLKGMDVGGEQLHKVGFDKETPASRRG